jgi:uncharacterized protein YqeY
MTILERVDQDFKEAMRSKDEIALSTLRLVRGALKNKQIEVQRELAEADVTGVLKTMIKQYQDALSDFRAAGRMDLAERQEKEIDLISRYLPASMPPEELERVVREALAGQEVKEFGKAMGLAVKAVAGRADGADVRKIVEKILSEG